MSDNAVKCAQHVRLLYVPLGSGLDQREEIFGQGTSVSVWKRLTFSSRIPYQAER